MGEDAKALTRSRCLAICGMAMLWPSVHNMLLYPIVFTYFKTGDTATYSFHIIYTVLVACVTILLIATRKKMSRSLFSNKVLMPLFGILGSLGMVLVSQLDFSNTVTILLLGVGVSFVALYTPIHFIFWGVQLSSQKGKSAAFDTALSLVVFCVLTGIQYAAGIHSIWMSIVFPLISAALSFLTLNRTDTVRPPETENLRMQPLGILVPCIVFTLICSVFIALFNGMSELAIQPPDKEMFSLVDAVVFTASAIIFKRDTNNPLIKAFALVSMVLVGAVSVACFISTDILNAGTVPMIAAKIAFEGLTWIIILDTCNRLRLNPIVPAALFFLFIVAQRFVRACIMYQGSNLTVAPSLFTLFALAAATAFAVSAVVSLCLVRFLGQAAKNQAAPTTTETLVVHPGEDASTSAALEAVQRTFDLSDREAEIVRFAYHNANAKQISEALFIAEGTVYSHFKRIYRKVDVHSKKELIAMVNEFKAR